MLWLVNRWQTINIVSVALWPLSVVYCGLMVLRRLAYRRGILRSYSVDVPVIIVGNFTVGGTGKTPLVIWLASWLKTQGQRPGIVLRGYGGASTTWPRHVREDTPAADVGDEAVLLARRTACPVVAAPDRVAAARQLLSQTNCTIIISDDGLQHYRLRRDFEISVIDGKRGLGNGLCLPAGPLREPMGRSGDVDLVVVNGESADSALAMDVRPVAFRNLKSGAQVPLADFENKDVHAVAGIGNPTRFFDTLRKIGTNSVDHPFPDHHQFCKSDLNFVDNRDIVMTEKDAVKCGDIAGENCWALVVDAVPTSATIEIIHTWLKEARIG